MHYFRPMMLAISLALCSQAMAFNPDKYEFGLLLDQHLEAPSGATVLGNGLNLYRALDDQFIVSTRNQTTLLPVSARLLKVLLLDHTLASWMIVAQHEYFGHGARSREFGLHHLGYRIRPFGGYSSSPTASWQRLTLSEQATITAGGIEASTVLAKSIRDRWLEGESMDDRQALVYVLGQTDANSQLIVGRNRYLSIDQVNTIDPYRYAGLVNQWHGSTVLTHGRMRAYGLADLADPYLFFSLMNIYRYIAQGDHSFEHPMFTLGDYQYLPGLRAPWAPYGPELMLSHYIRTPQNQIQIEMRYGHTGKQRSWATAVEFSTAQLFEGGGRLHLELWRQPSLFTNSVTQSRNRLGGALAVHWRYPLSPGYHLSSQLGYKTEGYMPGEMLKASPIIRLGFSYRAP